MKRGEEMVVITKTYDLILWSCNHTSKFPRNHRFVLGERIERNLYDLLETMIEAKYSRQRQQLLQNVNLKLEILRFQLRLAKDLECLKANSYQFASKAVDEIGRLVHTIIGCAVKKDHERVAHDDDHEPPRFGMQPQSRTKKRLAARNSEGGVRYR